MNWQLLPAAAAVVVAALVAYRGGAAVADRAIRQGLSDDAPAPDYMPADFDLDDGLVDTDWFDDVAAERPDTPPSAAAAVGVC